MGIINTIKSTAGKVVEGASRIINNATHKQPRQEEITYTKTETLPDGTVQVNQSHAPPNIPLKDKLNFAMEKHKQISESIVSSGQAVVSSFAGGVADVRKKVIESSQYKNAQPMIERVQKRSIKEDVGLMGNSYITAFGGRTKAKKGKGRSKSIPKSSMISQPTHGLSGSYDVNSGFSSERSGSMDTMNGYDIDSGRGLLGSRTEVQMGNQFVSKAPVRAVKSSSDGYDINAGFSSKKSGRMKTTNGFDIDSGNLLGTKSKSKKKSTYDINDFGGNFKL